MYYFQQKANRLSDKRNWTSINKGNNQGINKQIYSILNYAQYFADDKTQNYLIFQPIS